MSRYHYWQFLVNQEGQPINGAEINVYLAGTDEPAFIYKSEFGSDGTDDAPQIITNKAGYFEFWLGDDTELDGYPIGQKFKITWRREGIASGSIDWIDIFPGFAPVDETDDNPMKNKLVSNLLAMGWQMHIQHQDVTTTAIPTFDQIRITSDPYNNYDVVTKEYADDLSKSLSWQRPVNSFHDPSTGDPSSKTSGDRYISTGTGTIDGVDWIENYIYEWNDYAGDSWIEIQPFNGYSVLVEDIDRHYTFNGTEWVLFSAGWDWYIISGDTNLQNRHGYLVDVSSAPATLLFPASPMEGSRIDILDFTYSSETNNITLSGNGELVEDQTSFIIDIDGAGLQFVYTNTTYGWKMINEVYSEDSLTKLYEEYQEIEETDSGWTDSGSGEYYININHDRGTSWPDVTVYDIDNRILLTPNQIKSVDNENIKLWFDNPLHIQVKLS